MNRPVTVEEWDEVVITGLASSPIHEFTDLVGTVATVDLKDVDGPFIKIWPADGQPDPNGTGKIWFRWADVERIEVTFRDKE